MPDPRLDQLSRLSPDQGSLDERLDYLDGSADVDAELEPAGDEGRTGHTATIRAADLSVVLAAAKLRRYNAGRTCQLAALSASPLIEIDCARNSQWTRPGLRDEARRFGLKQCRNSPLQRGHIALVYERINRQHGRREVLRTWGAGIRSLRAEPQHVLNGGSAG